MLGHGPRRDRVRTPGRTTAAARSPRRCCGGAVRARRAARAAPGSGRRRRDRHRRAHHPGAGHLCGACQLPGTGVGLVRRRRARRRPRPRPVAVRRARSRSARRRPRSTVEPLLPGYGARLPAGQSAPRSAHRDGRAGRRPRRLAGGRPHRHRHGQRAARHPARRPGPVACGAHGRRAVAPAGARGGDCGVDREHPARGCGPRPPGILQRRHRTALAGHPDPDRRPRPGPRGPIAADWNYARHPPAPPCSTCCRWSPT